MFNKIKKFITNRDIYYPNIQIFSYYLFKAVKKTLLKFSLIKPQKLGRDMFDWPLYYLHYQGELKEMEKNYLLSLSPSDYEFTNEKLIKKNNAIKPLHLSHRFLYETIMLLKPQSVFEMGCGTGINLHNLKTLIPRARICGIDISEKQINNLKKTYPDLVSAVKQMDATIPFDQLPYETCDIAFTQAVIMHIHTDSLYYEALTNLFKMAKKYVLLMESDRTHNYIEYIKKLQSEKNINWENIYFYNRVDPETKQPLSIICSKEQLPSPEYNLFI